MLQALAIATLTLLWRHNTICVHHFSMRSVLYHWRVICSGESSTLENHLLPGMGQDKTPSWKNYNGRASFFHPAFIQGPHNESRRVRETPEDKR